MFAKSGASHPCDRRMRAEADGRARLQGLTKSALSEAGPFAFPIDAHPRPTLAPRSDPSRRGASQIPQERPPSRRADGEGVLGPDADAPLRVVVMLDASGSILYHTADAERLFSLLDGASGERGLKTDRCGPMLDTIRAVARCLVEASKGRPARPPHVSRRTDWGHVTIEATWLVPPRAETDSRDPLGVPVAVHVELCEHAPASAARALRARGATPAQVRVGAFLVMGKSKPEIARMLGVKESSVQDAARRLFTKLDVRNAAELGMLLWLKTSRDRGAGKA